MSLWANILEVILEFTMVVIILVLNGNSNNNFTSWDFHFDNSNHFFLMVLAPTGAQGVKMSVCVSVCVTFFKREL